jgi:DNA-binding IclR family transcriptional regulator
MVFREVSVIEIREVLRSWLAGAGLRTVAAQAGVDRKTARRYVDAAVAAGLARDDGSRCTASSAKGGRRSTPA